MKVHRVKKVIDYHNSNTFDIVYIGDVAVISNKYAFKVGDKAVLFKDGDELSNEVLGFRDENNKLIDEILLNDKFKSIKNIAANKMNNCFIVPYFIVFSEGYGFVFKCSAYKNRFKNKFKKVFKVFKHVECFW